MKRFNTGGAVLLELGGQLNEVTIAYHTYGTLNSHKSNVIWICHALTASSDAAAWWPGFVGPGCMFNTNTHFVVCANILGSAYGTTGPLGNNSAIEQPYYHQFPEITIRDIVQAHILLRKHLQLPTIQLLVGGSMGGYQALEWAAMEKEVIEKVILMATSAAESAWGIAIHTTQRMAIETDSTWQQPIATAGSKGLKVARAIGLLSYRNYQLLVEKQTDHDPNKTNDFKASSYMTYQGEKLVKRFNAYSYWFLTKAMDTHNIARGRAGTIAEVLATIPQPTLVIGITSDILCPLAEQAFMAKHVPHATLATIDSPYGHDGFMVEAAKIGKVVNQWLLKF